MLKLLATRIGANAKLCILGDPEQLDRRAGNWDAGCGMAQLVRSIEDGETSRKWRCVELGIDDCFRHETAREAIRIFEGIDETPRGRPARAEPGRAFGAAIMGAIAAEPGRAKG